MSSRGPLVALILSLHVASGCASIAGIEAGQLRDDQTAGAGATSTAGSLPTAGDGSWSGGSGTSSGGTPNSSAGTGSGGADPGGLGGAFAGTANGGASAGTSGSNGSGGGNGTCPADMIRASSSQGSPFCIDPFEVTNADYLAFTQQHTPASTSQTGPCAANDSFLPAAGCANTLMDIPSGALPVVCVDWCDAAAYCASIGKRLCGRIGGGANPRNDQADEWFAACTGPDGRAQSGNQCNDSTFDGNAMTAKAAAQIPDCEGGVPGLFNMSGNVAEWENSCSGTDTRASCNVRGGSFLDTSDALLCTSANGIHRVTQSDAVGIRCCANAD